MKFSRKKLPKDAIQSLRRISIDLCEPNSILLTPVYVYLPKNQKFVALKAPLQYFTPSELEKLKPYENFYLPEFIDQIAPFQRAGESVRNLLTIRQRRSIRTNQGSTWVSLPMPQYELDDAALRMIGSLWSKGAKVEPFFLCFFANEVCRPIEVNKMTEAIEKGAEVFELALLRASSSIFLALHLGYSDSKTLSLLRDTIFNDTANGREPGNSSSEIAQMTILIRECIPNTDAKEISLDGIQKILQSTTLSPLVCRVAKKLQARLGRVEGEFINSNSPISSLFGEKGLLDE